MKQLRCTSHNVVYNQNYDSWVHHVCIYKSICLCEATYNKEQRLLKISDKNKLTGDHLKPEIETLSGRKQYKCKNPFQSW